jgi:hypothetical protein
VYQHLLGALVFVLWVQKLKSFRVHRTCIMNNTVFVNPLQTGCPKVVADPAPSYLETCCACLAFLYVCDCWMFIL